VHKLAFLTVGVLHEQHDSPRVQGFVDRIPSVYGAADHSDGFHGRSIRDINTWKHSWGEQTPPQCYARSVDDPRVAMTLSLWADLESVAAFAYHGPHAEALTKRRDWFPTNDLPVYVAWWVPAEASISWPEGSERLDHLHANGSTPFAFNFSHPFDALGNAVRLDAAAVKLKAALNAANPANPKPPETPL
jgi:hypothetical protein